VSLQNFRTEILSKEFASRIFIYKKNIKNEQIKITMGRIIAGKTSDITPGKMIKVSIDGRDILVANIDGEYCATDDSCTHSGSSLSEGKLDGCTITCGWHAAEFDCKTGKFLKFPVKLRDLTSYDVIVESDNVFVEM
jgi:nitrite reductase/ring-hydroxylating ferredoxin subunit